MKTKAIAIHINQLAGEVEKAINLEKDYEQICRLLDVKEYLRRAWHCAGQIPFEPNDTRAETKSIC